MDPWEAAYRSCKPLIVQAIISGPDIVDIAYVYLNMMVGRGIEDAPIEPKYLDYMPRKKRKAVEQLYVNDFIFSNNLKIKSFDCKATFWEYKIIPFVTTSISGNRHYGGGIVFNENLQDYIPVLKEIIAKERFDKFGASIYINYEAVKVLNIKEDILENARVVPDESMDEGEVADKYNVFLLIKEYINGLYQKLQEGDKIFDGKKYCIPKAISILSE